MNRFNPDKLRLSKWTATQPQNKEKHFLITELLRDENGVLVQVELQAALTQRSQWIDWRELRDDQRWLFGWQ
ncbi:TIGR02450 family Trp-rich protein [Stutzerimonas xanthomarina]|uniref:TIGR02450 family Trp-rich protein n=1 Tax=Stutzerimonas xanthomarina TaxID=271420 RepID=UPI003AA8AF26